MAKFITKGKRKRFLAFASVALSVAFSVGALAACGGSETADTDEEPEVAAPTDTQTIKNGNFEFFSEMTEDTLSERRNLIHSPNSWTITTVSPSSDTKSGIIDTKQETWNYLAKSGRALTGLDDAYEHWDDEAVSAYDRLKFLDDYKTELDNLSAGTQRDFFNTYRSGGSDVYTIDYEDVKDLDGDFPEGVTLHDGVKEGDSHVLMLHNYENSDGVLGTAVYATSSTTITLSGGTAAKVSFWVCTDKLRHYYEATGADTEVEKDAGAYLAVTNTVGGNSSSPQFIIKNINTKGAWEQYTVYIRANTYATTTYRLVVGLGRNTSSDNRLEAVNGYAFFDDVVGETISDAAYKEATEGENALPAEAVSTLNSSAAERIKDATELKSVGKYDRTFAFDLLAAETFEDITLGSNVEVKLTSEDSGARTVYSKVDDNRDDGVTEKSRQSIAEATTYSSLEQRATEGSGNYNGYLKSVFDADFAGKFPFGEDADKMGATDVIMLLSTNGAAYTATLTDPNFSLKKDEYMLVSFFVKTSEIGAGKTGASVILIDGENKTSISAFDSTTVDTVDIDKDHKDIYSGWVQCFFIVKNESSDEGAKTFSLAFTYGPTSIVSSTTSDYADGYAAFTDFKYVKLTKAQANYASTGNYAKSVSLTEYTKDTTKFDDAAASYNIEKGLANPANFRKENFTESDTVYSGLLNAEYKKTYYDNAAGDEALTALKTMPAAAGCADEKDWWSSLFGDERRTGRSATQPLVIYNSADAAAASHGYTLKNFSSTVSANSTQRISVRLKVSAGLHAYVYLYDYSDPKTGLTNTFAPELPAVSYWYDDDGNIVKGDPSAKEYNKKTDVLYYLRENGLYTKEKLSETPTDYYANLHNFDTDAKGNLITKGENSQIVFFRNENDEADTNFYAYREGDEGSYTYSQPVKNLPTDIARYASRDLSGYASVLEIEGTAETEKTWATVSFYVRTGSESKTYTLAIWAGQPGAAEGMPQKSFLFADSYKNESSSDFETLRSDRVDTLKENTENLDPDNKDNLKADFALYYAFSFYDSARYVRYDATQETDSPGSPWVDYKPSDYAEDIAWLHFDTLSEETGAIGTELFLDYTVSEVDVAEHVYDTDEDTDTEEEETTGDSSTNVWTIISASVLSVALIFAIVAVIVRKIYKNRSKMKVKVVKDKKQKPKAKKPEPDEPAPETPDENDPYNE